MPWRLPINCLRVCNLRGLFDLLNIMLLFSRKKLWVAFCGILVTCQFVCGAADFHKPSLVIYALRYAADSLYPASSVFIDHHDHTQLPFSWIAYLILADNKAILIDTGFSNQKYQKIYHIHQLFPISGLLAQVGLSVQNVTDVILTHSHMDHTGNIGLFSQAHFFIQQDEYVAMQKNSFLKTQLQRMGAGRRTIFKNNHSLGHGVRIRRIGGHTKGSCLVEFIGRQQEFLFSGDNCYLQENCRKKRYIANAVNPKENRKFIDAYYDYPGVILTHHDPNILKQSKQITENVFLVYQE